LYHLDDIPDPGVVQSTPLHPQWRLSYLDKEINSSVEALLKSLITTNSQPDHGGGKTGVSRAIITRKIARPINSFLGWN
jgi:hypothetical protein